MNQFKQMTKEIIKKEKKVSTKIKKVVEKKVEKVESSASVLSVSPPSASIRASNPRSSASLLSAPIRSSNPRKSASVPHGSALVPHLSASSPHEVRMKSASSPHEVRILSASVYDQNGKEIDKIKLPENIFGLSWNADLVHQVVTCLLSDSRVIYAHTKDRGQVSGGGKKPWKQKRTGRARHGSTRSPIWVGGGVAHGPNGLKNYARKINKKMKVKALYTILSRKLKDGEILFVDKFEIAEPKTIEAIKILKSFGKIETCSDIFTKKKNSAIIAISEKSEAIEKSFANIGNVKVDEVRNINSLDLLNKKYLVIENPVESIKFLENKITKVV